MCERSTRQMPPDDDVFSVSELTGMIKQTLESVFPAVWLSGELSDIAQPRSGHIYFTVKDSAAQIRGVIWRATAERIKFDLQDGQQVVMLGQIDVYPPRGGYQLIVRRIHPVGEGALQLALRQLQERLGKEGLFDTERKKTLPRFPRRIAVITSPTGAAIRDFLEVLRRRWRGIHVLVIPVQVQGPGSAEQIARAVGLANRIRPAVDAIVVTRGGGSMEDLWSFNEEVVVRAVSASKRPVVSAIGHEIDVTLTDLVADVRALTPSEAAERIVPSSEAVAANLASLRTRLAASLRGRAAEARAKLDAIASRPVIERPLERIRQMAQNLDELNERARRAIEQQMRNGRSQLDVMGGKLSSLSPLNVLQRGYSVTQSVDGSLITDSRDVEVGQEIRSLLSRGVVASKVLRVVRDSQGHRVETSEGDFFDQESD